MGDEQAHAWTAGALEQALAELELPAPAPPVDPLERDWTLLAAAAVLSTFAPADLRTLDGAVPDAAALSRLLESCTVVHGTARARWRLKPDVRREALRRLGSREAMTAALAANPEHPPDQLQAVLDQHIAGDAPPPRELRAESLACTLEVSRWLHGVLDGVPDPDDVRRLLDMSYLLEPFRALADDGFRGRRRELRRLRRYVGAREPTGALESAGRLLRWGLGLHERPPLVVRGIGGIGKSTLLARFILEHAAAPDGEHVSFAYVDFDRADVTPAEPASILLEAARQLAAQHADQRELLLDFRLRWSRVLAHALQANRVDALSSDGTAAVAVGDAFAVSTCISEFAALAALAVGEEQPLLLVLDTFEEVQYRSRHYVEAIWDLLDEVQRRVPALRTVIAGRAKLDGFTTVDLELPPLDDEAAAELLRAHGVDDADTVRQIVKHLGGNPLTLRLAAQVVAQDGSGTQTIEEIRRRGKLKKLFALREQAVQAQLYRRILSHVHTPEIAALAHPGLTLRRITPEVIADVLAEPCGLGRVDAARATELFEELRREVSLVTTGPDGALEHRPDVRRTMLPLLRADDRRAVEAIHAAAISHYETRKGVVARGEELYHRLSLDQPAATLDARWLPGVDDRLRTAIEELPARAQTYLASRLGVELDPSVWENASLEDHERKLEQEARSLLRVGRPEEAWKLLRAQRERTASSPLYVLEAITARELGDYEAAHDAIRRGLDAASGVGTTRTELELLQLSATLQLELGDVADARARLEVARKAAAWLDDTAQAEAIDAQLRALDELPA